MPDSFSPNPGSVTALIERLKGGDHEAVRLLWQRYYPRLVALALLRQAVVRGYKNVAHMKKTPDLDPLRARKEFHKLLADLEAKTKE